MSPNDALEQYATETQRLALSETTGEATYYPIIRGLIASVLESLQLPSNVRQNTIERRVGGGIDVPDLALYNEEGDFAIAPVEAKMPAADIRSLAMSTERNNQVGRYLQQSRILIVTNIWSMALVAARRNAPGGPVMPEHRSVVTVINLWPHRDAFVAGAAPTVKAAADICELLELALTGFATISEPSSLAKVLAMQARRAKAALPTAFTQAVKGLQDDFSQALGITFVGTAGEEFFRSSLVQTVFYALFAGWALHWQSRSERPFVWQDLPSSLRIPFLGKLFYDIQHPDRIMELGLRDHLDRATDTLQRVDPETFFLKLRAPALEGYDDRAVNAVTYFYEPFLEAFDPVLRKLLGVWYTPPEIVRYQVRKVDAILRSELGCDLGFADPRVVTLDPCCGTGAYLIEVVRCIAETLRTEGYEHDLGDRLIDALCTRVIGFEILTAPFVIAHLQLYLVLASLGVEPTRSERLAVFLTNALTGWRGEDQLKLNFPELQDEYDLSRRVKRDARIIVILGNPPYSRWVDDPDSHEPVLIREEFGLVDHYKGITRNERGKQIGSSGLYTQFGIRKQTLNDSYVRFWRLAEERIANNAQYGVVSFISNSSFYTGRSHPIMRESLLSGFSAVWLDNLNGDKYKTGKVIPAGLPGAGTADQSVFTTDVDPRGIQVGVAVTTLLKLPSADATGARLHYRDFWGRADAKRHALTAALVADKTGVGYEANLPAGPRPYLVLRPTLAKRYRFATSEPANGYDDWPSVEELFTVGYQGVNPNRGIEGGLIETERSALERRMKDYYSDAPFREFSENHPVLSTKRARYNPEALREDLRLRTSYDPSRIVPYVVFPMDRRFVYYESEGKLLNERRQDLWDNLPGNQFLIVVPQPRRVSEARPLFATCLFDLHLHDRGSVGIPAVLQSDAELADLFNGGGKHRTAIANLDASVWRLLRNAWGLSGELDGDDALSTVRRLFHYALTIGHTPQFEEDHSEALGAEAMRLPVPADADIFNALADAGEKVAILIDPMSNARDTMLDILGDEFSTLSQPTSASGRALREEDFAVTIAHFGSARGGWRPASGVRGNLHISESAYFANVPESVWDYELGGYPVLKKWLGYRDARRRHGQPLTREERDWLREIVQRIAALIRLRETLDTLYLRALQNTLSFD